MRKIIVTSGIQLFSNLFTKKTIASIMLIFGALYVALFPMCQVADIYGIGINIGVVSYVLSGVLVCPVIVISVIFVFSDLPVKNPPPQFILFRSGKRNWMASQLLYVVFMSILITIIIFVSACIICGGRITISDDWGKLENAIASGQISYEYGINTVIDRYSLIEYAPGDAFWFTMGGACATFVMIGWISIVFNMYIFELSGTVMNAIILLLWMVEGYFPSAALHYISPIAWCSVGIVTRNNSGVAPGIVYVSFMRIGILGILAATALIRTGKNGKTLEILERNRA